jgi:hypothetical protein
VIGTYQQRSVAAVHDGFSQTKDGPTDSKPFLSLLIGCTEPIGWYARPGSEQPDT